MKNFIQDDDFISVQESLLTHPTHSDGLVDSGDPVALGSLVGIACASAAASTDLISIATRGVVQVATSGSVAAGDQLYIDGSGVVSTDASGTAFGVAVVLVSSGLWAVKLQSNSSTIQTATVTLSAVQLKALASNFYQLIAAPGSGKFVEVERLIVDYKFGTVAYTDVPGNAGLFLNFGNVAPAVNSTMLLTAGNIYNLLLAAESQAIGSPISVPGIDRTNVVNKGIYLTNDDGGNDFADGDGTLTVTVLYSVVTLQ